MTVAWLNDSAPAQVFRNIDLQLLFFEKRMQFKNQKQKEKINFNSAYFCRGFLPKQIDWADFSHIGQQNLF